MGLYVHQFDSSYKRGVKFKNKPINENASIWACLANGSRVEICITAQSGISIRSLDGFIRINPHATNACDISTEGF